MGPRWQEPFKVADIPHDAQVQYWKDGQHWIASRREVKKYTPCSTHSPQLTKVWLDPSTPSNGCQTMALRLSLMAQWPCQHLPPLLHQLLGHPKPSSLTQLPLRRMTLHQEVQLAASQEVQCPLGKPALQPPLHQQ